MGEERRRELHLLLLLFARSFLQQYIVREKHTPVARPTRKNAAEDMTLVQSVEKNPGVGVAESDTITAKFSTIQIMYEL
jgi:hypothetical protein